MTNFYRQDVHADHMVLWNTNHTARNALSPGYYAGLITGLAEAADKPAIGSVILAGEGGFFCSGGDLNILRERRELSLEERHAQINKLHNVIKAVRDCPKPVIAAVEGGAAGAGLSLALACDMVVSAAEAKFVLAYVRAGLVPDGGVTYQLMQSLPRATASQMAILAQPMTAERLYELGVITEVVEQGKALGAAQVLAGRIAQGPEKAIASIKSLLTNAQSATFEEQLEVECTAMAEALGGDEAQTGIKAFFNKQRPVFR